MGALNKGQGTKSVAFFRACVLNRHYLIRGHKRSGHNKGSSAILRLKSFDPGIGGFLRETRDN